MGSFHGIRLRPRMPGPILRPMHLSHIEGEAFHGGFRRRILIELYYWPTPNGWKITIMLEECGLPYDVQSGQHRQGRAVRAGVPGDLAEQPHAGDRRSRRAGRQADLDLRVRRDPAISRPQDRQVLSGRTSARASRSTQWLFWQMGGLGPMAGQAHHFRIYAPEKIALRHRPLHQRVQPPLRRA